MNISVPLNSSQLATYSVGLILLLTGLAKSVHSGQFIQHLHKYQLFPSSLIASIAIMFIGLETALGSALIINEHTKLTILMAILLITSSSALTLWASYKDKIEDCGCYSGLIILTPQQSLLINSGYLFLLIAAYLAAAHTYHAQNWHYILTISLAMTAIVLSMKSQKKPIIDLSRLKLKNRWKSSWLRQSSVDITTGANFVVFLGSQCHACHRWVPFLNMVSHQQSLPTVVAIMSSVEGNLEDFVEQQNVKFPVLVMNHLLFNNMINEFPTGVLLEDGVITKKWIGTFPEDFLSELKNIYINAINGRLSNVSSS